MGKTLLFFLMVSWKLSFCIPEPGAFIERNDSQGIDLMISEILFNPRPGGVDFVEIYNPTDRDLSLNGVQLGNIDTAGNAANIKALGTGTIAGGSYWVISTSSVGVKNDYHTSHPDHFIQLVSMPAYNNTSGHVVLLRNNQVIDRLDYTEKMHLPVLKIVEGVSLERVSFDKAANTPGNFLSAAASVGFATPGDENSVQENTGIQGNKLILEAKIFSPDNDGFEDLLKIAYQLKHYGNVATMNIFSDRGILIRRLLKNGSVAAKGELSWDGLDEEGQKCPFGIYILIFEGYDINGGSFRLKEAFALAGKLN